MLSHVQLRTAVSPSESLNNARAQTNALSKQQMENRLLQAQGNLAQQQANFTPYQYATQALANPNIWLGEGGKEAATNLINQLPALAKLGVNAGGSNNQLGQLDSQSLGQMILQKIGGGISNAFGRGNNAPQGGQPNAMTAPQGGQSQQGSPLSSAPYGVPNTPAAIAAQGNSGGLNTAPNPIQTQETNNAAQKQAVLGQTATQTDEQKASNIAINNQSSGAIAAGKALDGWYKNYKDSTYKGQYLGSHPTTGKGSIPNAPGHNNSPEQKAENFSNQLLQITTDMQALPGAQTDLGREILSGAKGVSLGLDEDAAKNLYESKKAGFDRLAKSRNFADNFYKNNPNATHENLIAMMNAYNEYAPAYDYKNEKPLPENDKKFKDFTSKEALQSYMQNGDYNPYEGKKETSENTTKEDLQGLPEGKIEDTSMHNGKKAYKINGEWYGA